MKKQRPFLEMTGLQDSFKACPIVENRALKKHMLIDLKYLNNSMNHDYR